MRIPDGLVSTLVEVLGLLLLVGGAWTFDARAGVAALGFVCFVLGVALGERTGL